MQKVKALKEIEYSPSRKSLFKQRIIQTNVKEIECLYRVIIIQVKESCQRTSAKKGESFHEDLKIAGSLP